MIEKTFNTVQAAFLELVNSQRPWFTKFSMSELVDLKHRAGELSHADDFSIRVAAEIIGACATLELEAREEKKT